MEWVETTGKTVAEAKDRALDQLGVDEQDAEFEVVAEPRPGLLGRMMRGEARVRARVRPTRPRPKVDRRERRRPRRDGGGGGGDRGRRGERGSRDRGRDERARGGRPPAASGDDRAAAAGGSDSGAPARTRRRGRSGSGSAKASTSAAASPPRDDEESSVTEIDLAQQEGLVEEFLRDLVDAFGVDAAVSTKVVEEDEAVEASIDGPELGLLVGSKGATLSAIQELARSVVQRRMPGERHGRIRLDVAGYRERRRLALERFAREVAEEVLASGARKALEPMSPPDRKVIHDTINEIEGVATASEGEEPRRRVVITPTAAE